MAGRIGHDPQVGGVGTLEGGQGRPGLGQRLYGGVRVVGDGCASAEGSPGRAKSVLGGRWPGGR
jgi:hypothetical protein